MTLRPYPIIFVIALTGSACLSVRSASADDVVTVTKCFGQTALPVSFKIDCTNVKDPEVKKLCSPFIQNQACKVFLAYRQITGINLEQICPSITYTIYDPDNWPPGAHDAGGLAGHFAIKYQARYSIETKSPIGPYDTHELLHEYQEVLGAIPYSHILFGPSQAEAMKLIGDIEAYEKAIARMKETTGAFEETFAKRASRPDIEKCVFAELQVEEMLYLENPKTVYAFYRKLMRSRVKDQADREARFNRMYNTVSGGKSMQFLVAHGCAPF